MLFVALNMPEIFFLWHLVYKVKLQPKVLLHTKTIVVIAILKLNINITFCVSWSCSIKTLPSHVHPRWSGERMEKMGAKLSTKKTVISRNIIINKIHINLKILAEMHLWSAGWHLRIDQAQWLITKFSATIACRTIYISQGPNYLETIIALSIDYCWSRESCWP